MQIIINRTIQDDEFTFVADGAELPSEPKILVSLARYSAEKEELFASGKALGVVVPSDKLPKDIPELQKLALIAVEFPKFVDGRGYSIGRLLREREKFQGQLRAVGYVLRDHLLAMERCGFNAFAMQAGKSLTSGLEAFSELPIAYQATVSDPRPLYRRRAN